MGPRETIVYAALRWLLLGSTQDDAAAPPSLIYRYISADQVKDEVKRIFGVQMDRGLIAATLAALAEDGRFHVGEAYWSHAARATSEIPRRGGPEAAWDALRDYFLSGGSSIEAIITDAGVRLYEDLAKRVQESKQAAPKPKPPAAPPAEPHVALSALHPTIRGASEKLFADGHYPQAVAEAFKALNQLARARTAKAKDDGVPMMRAIFRSQPGATGLTRLLLNDLADAAKEDEQEGFMNIMVGVQQHINNVAKHGTLGVTTSLDAMERLALASLLARRIDAATPRVDP